MSVISEVTAQGQSIWFDYIQRSMIFEGRLHQMVQEDSLRGVTSNPSIFNKAIGDSADYAPAMRAAVRLGGGPKDVFEQIAITDIQMAADVLRPVYTETEALDGYVSLEVSPYLAFDTDGTIIEAVRLWSEVARENLMIKIPATNEGLEAIEYCIAEGINVNVTLLFAVDAYERVAWAYIQGLEKRLARGEDISRIASVASFFISRIDAAVDKELDQKHASANSEAKSTIEGLKGKIAIANAKVAYQKYQEICQTERYQKLVAAGAKPQRLLWASTSTKNPSYRDVMYIEELIGPDTVNTVPEKTYDAFKDHGSAEPRLLDGLEDAEKSLVKLNELGVSLSEITDELLAKGVIAFADAFDELLGTVESRRRSFLGPDLCSLQIQAPNQKEEIQEGLDALRKDGFGRRLWDKDEQLFEGKDSRRSMGWLTDPQELQEQLFALSDFADDIEESGIDSVVWLGTGGSARSARVFSEILPAWEAAPALYFLDSTHPDAIKEVESKINLETTAFIVASKSGCTAEPRALADYFFEKVGEEATWYAITDPDTELEALAESRDFDGLLYAEPDVGGRFASLTAFGLAAPALLGHDLVTLLSETETMIGSCDASCPPAENPGLKLGVALATMSRAGHNKLTLCLGQSLRPFGAHLQQLVDESLGKNGKGLVVVDAEGLAAPTEYGNDRCFVSILASGETRSEKLDALIENGHPHLQIDMARPEMIGQLFFLWQIAVSTAGHLLKINPFDQANVEESKKKSREILAADQALKLEDALPGERLLGETDAFLVYGCEDLAQHDDLASGIIEYARGGGSGAYLALLAFLHENPSATESLQALRRRVRSATQIATSLGFGPSYLHASGQMHKGGIAQGRFVVFTDSLLQEDHGTRLLNAQAAGDVLALRGQGRGVLRVHLKKGIAAALA
jgi:transaldolase/glucose-6-phosphate isomerase